MKVKDSNGAPLSEGDSVTLIKDLKVKGTSVTLKRGTLIKSIRLTSQFIAQPLRTLFNSSSNGDLRWLDALLSDLFVYGGGYDPAQIVTINIDDMIQGAVFDVTAGARDVARSIAEPYSFAIFERAGQIICKRAFTNDALVIDAVISSAGDIVDNP